MSSAACVSRKRRTLIICIFLGAFCALLGIGRLRKKNSLPLSTTSTQKKVLSRPTYFWNRSGPESVDCLTVNLSDFRYSTISENETQLVGIPFNLSLACLRNLGIPLTDFAPVSREKLDEFVFVTAANNDYFFISMDAIGSVQRFFPTHHIYFYDLSDNMSPQRIKKIQNLRNVIYRKFHFARYPSHVRHLKNYAFKPLLMHDMLMEFPNVFWIDASIRFLTNNITSSLDQVYSNKGILAFSHTGHSTFAATHPGMYDYLPISKRDAVRTKQREANSIYFVRTREVYERIVFWWVLCALRKDCMAAGNLLNCDFKPMDVWCGCHRFDQSAINILMANYYDYDDLRYLSRDRVLDVKRGSAHKELLSLSEGNKPVRPGDYFR